MGKNKNKAPPPTAGAAEPAPAAAPAAAEPAAPEPQAESAASSPAAPTPAAAAPAKSRLRTLLPDLVKVALSLAVIVAGAIIWYQPPLIPASDPTLTYTFRGRTYADATLYRPLAMPTRFYVQLPRTLENRYTWFAVDRRREVAALTEAPAFSLLGRPAIRRGAPLGLDLEFRKLDNAEWRVFFLPEEIVFSNAVLAVSLRVGRPADAGTR